MGFVFDRGQAVQCATWNHVLTALDGVVEVVDLIIQAPSVQALPRPILDDFAEAVAAGRARE